MKNKLIFICFLILASLAGFSSGIFVTHIISAHTSIAVVGVQQVATAVVSTPMPAIVQIPTEPEEVVHNPCPKPQSEYEDETYRSVGQDAPLEDETYIPSDLVPLPKNISKYSNLCVKAEVAAALEHMIGDAKADGKIIVVSSGFRDYDTQNMLLKNNIKETGIDPSLSVAKPGYSEHQLGVAVDLTSPSIANSSASGTFGDTPESAWLEQNAYKYGFIQSYPKGKESITGYIYEPWHYRYVDTANANQIHMSGETITEFLQ